MADTTYVRTNSYSDSDIDRAERSDNTRWVWPAIIALAVIGLIAWAFAQGANPANTTPNIVPNTVSQPL